MLDYSNQLAITKEHYTPEILAARFFCGDLAKKLENTTDFIQEGLTKIAEVVDKEHERILAIFAE